MNLEGAKAMAHLQGGPGTKATVGFEQDEALYLVYDNNEIRLPHCGGFLFAVHKNGRFRG